MSETSNNTAGRIDSVIGKIKQGGVVDEFVRKAKQGKETVGDGTTFDLSDVGAESNSFKLNFVGPYDLDIDELHLKRGPGQTGSDLTSQELALIALASEYNLDAQKGGKLNVRKPRVFIDAGDDWVKVDDEVVSEIWDKLQ